jgi:hypothetical protein
LPRQRIAQQLNKGELVVLNLAQAPDQDNFIAWKISNKGKGLAALTKNITATIREK